MTYGFRLTVAFLSLILSSHAVFAQSNVPAAEVSGGYAFLSDGDINFPVGFFGDVGVSVSDSIQIVGELGYHRATETEFGIDVDLVETTFVGGPRFVTRGSRVTGFVQGLVGVGKVSGTPDIDLGFDLSVSTTVLAYQFGGGVIVPLGENGVGLRVGADYQGLNSDEFGNSNQFRVTAGVSFGLGER